MVLGLWHGLADVVYGCQQLVTLQKESLWLCSRVQVTEVTVYFRNLVMLYSGLLTASAPSTA